MTLLMQTAMNEKPVKRTRAQVLRDRIEIRLATNECGPLIAEVLKSNDIELPGADFSRVFPHWLIACDKNAPKGQEIIGCIMVLPSKPFGFLEFLFTRTHS